MKRREFIGGMAMAAAAVPCGAFADEVHEGQVTGGGKPLAGVVVTDGLKCVATDADGRFRLARRAGARFISVTIPTGWRAEDRHYRAVGEGKFDFRLVPWQPSTGTSCSFLQLADSETTVFGWVKEVKAEADAADVAFIVHTGDICRRNGMEAHAKNLTAKAMGRPVYYCVGNHDLSGEDGKGESVFEELFGPCWYSFDANGVHFIVTPMPGGDHRPSYTQNQVAEWMRNDLALVPKGRRVVVFNHMLTNPWSEAEMGMKIGKGAAALDIAASCNFVAFVYGHVHHAYFRRRRGVALIASAPPNKGGISHDPAASRIVKIAPDGRVTADSRYYPKSSWKSSRAGAVWETELGAPVFRAIPVVAGDRLFTATLDEDGLGTGAVVALRAKDGAVLWRAPMANSVRGQIVHHDGLVVAQDVEGHVRAFSAADGSPVWKYDLKTPAQVWCPVFSGLVLDGGRGIVYAGFGSGTTALEAKTGRVVWSGLKGWKGDGEPLNTRSAVGEGVLVVPSQWRGIHANDAATGEHLWLSKEHGEFSNGSEPLIMGERVYVPVEKFFHEYELRTGKLLRSLPLSNGKGDLPSSVIFADGKFLFGTWRGLLAVDAKTFREAWRITMNEALVVNGSYCGGGSSVSAAPVMLNEKSGLVAGQDGTIRIFDFADGSVTRTIETGAPYFAAPVVADGVVYAADFAGRVRAFAI